MPGVVTAIAAWMLDSVVCAGMATIGAPCVSVSALRDLHHLLIEGGFRQSSRDDPNIVQEEQHEESARIGATGDGPAPTEHGARFGAVWWIFYSYRRSTAGNLLSLLGQVWNLALT
jgi:hypothetical protein